MAIKAVLFDFGGVLVHDCITFMEYGKIVARKLANRIGVNIDGNALGNWLEAKFLEVYRTAIERRLEDLIWEFLSNNGINVEKEVIIDIMEEIMEQDYCKFDEHAETVIKKLYQEGYKLCVVSNWLEEFPRKFLKRKGLDRYFECIILSCDVGVRKPRREIFEEAIKFLGIKPEEALFVGDLEWTDVEGAKSVGMKTVLYSRDSTETKADYKISNLLELLNIVKLEKNI